MKSEIILKKLKAQLPLSKYYSGLFKKSWLMILLLTVVSAGCKKVVEEVGLTGVCPIVISTDPAPGAINVSTSKKITATFNEVMDPVTINGTTFILKQGTNQIPGAVTYTGTTATFTPSSPLVANTVYSATVTTGVKDPQRNAMIADYTWTFNTGATPVVVSTDPANGATDVPFNKVITATFSTTMDPASITSSSYIIRQGNTVVGGVVTFAGTVATFTPTSPLAPNTAYTGTVTTAAKDLLGNAMAANYVWSFATGVTPIVVSTDPPDGATNVVLNKVITAVFNKSMNAASVISAFTIKQGTNNVAGTVTYAGKTATFTPSALLAINTLYTGTITTAAKDSSGNSLVSNYTWTFTTGDAPIVVSTDPANGATNVPLNKTITANFSTAMNAATIVAPGTFTIKQGANNVAGVVTYAGTTATFKPAAALAPNTVYTGTITTAAKDVAGNAMSANYVWTFTTTGLPPTVTSTDPAPGATNVILSKTITANFSKVMDPSTINVLTYTLKQGANPVTGTVSYSGTTATFNPLADLAANTTYTATVTNGAKDASGNAMVADYVWSFTTVASVPPPPPDILKTAALFGAFGGNAGITNQGVNTVINNGSIGTTAAATLITGFHDGTTGDVYTETGDNIGLVKVRIHTAPPPPGSTASFDIAKQALIDANAAYIAISPAGKPGGIVQNSELGNKILTPGIYKSSAATFDITTGDLTLDAQGDPNAQWFFQAPAGLNVGTTAAARSVKLINGALAKNVYWYVGSKAVISDVIGGGVMVGTIIATSGITFSTAGQTTQTVLNGRAISLVASVTMVNTTINVP
ncbi:MAG: hypothetical protein JWN76_3484 [Chitinophagaceae bacterium]|nr:hypothetical protein [Chitinophagaceae bacterium]